MQQHETKKERSESAVCVDVRTRGEEILQRHVYSVCTPCVLLYVLLCPPCIHSFNELILVTESHTHTSNTVSVLVHVLPYVHDGVQGGAHFQVKERA